MRALFFLHSTAIKIGHIGRRRSSPTKQDRTAVNTFARRLTSIYALACHPRWSRGCMGNCTRQSRQNSWNVYTHCRNYLAWRLVCQWSSFSKALVSIRRWTKLNDLFMEREIALNYIEARFDNLADRRMEKGIWRKITHTCEGMFCLLQCENVRSMPRMFHFFKFFK